MKAMMRKRMTRELVEQEARDFVASLPKPNTREFKDEFFADSHWRGLADRVEDDDLVFALRLAVQGETNKSLSPYEAEVRRLRQSEWRLWNRLVQIGFCGLAIAVFARWGFFGLHGRALALEAVLIAAGFVLPGLRSKPDHFAPTAPR